MLIGGTLISSLEYHGNMSLVVFMAKCPLRCKYCHNEELLDGGNETTFDEIKVDIDKAVDFIDAIVISGGEPLVQIEEIADILRYAKSLDLKTKLDTSGVIPDNLKKLLDENLLDAISLDIKAPFYKYKKIVGSNVGSNVEKAMNLINEYEDVLLEARTTFVPKLLNKKDIKLIANEIEADIYTIQQFRNQKVLDPELEEYENPNPLELKKLAEELPIYFNGSIRVKTAEFGIEEIE